MRQQKLDKLWASLPEEELRQFVLDAYMEKFLNIATSYGFMSSHGRRFSVTRGSPQYAESASAAPPRGV